VGAEGTDYSKSIIIIICLLFVVGEGWGQVERI
jgi:hypothetical protein